MSWEKGQVERALPVGKTQTQKAELGIEGAHKVLPDMKLSMSTRTHAGHTPQKRACDERHGEDEE